MPKELKEMPAFKNEDEEREFWASHDSTEYINWDEAEAIILPKLKPSTRTISLRLPELMLNELRVIANKRDIPYQSLIKIFLKERIDQELKRETEKRMALSAE
jgi:predicted DNA binding CopG/RHH family protein